MCIHQTTYNNAINKRNEAIKEITRCTEAIDYFNRWKKKVSNCCNVISQLKDQNAKIARQCYDIILNGKPIDEGENHYYNGNGDKYTIDLRIMESALNRLINEIQNQLSKLNESLTKSQKSRDEANYTLSITPKPPCGNCRECKPPVATPAPALTINSPISNIVANTPTPVIVGNPPTPKNNNLNKNSNTNKNTNSNSSSTASKNTGSSNNKNNKNKSQSTSSIRDRRKQFCGKAVTQRF